MVLCHRLLFLAAACVAASACQTNGAGSAVTSAVGPASPPVFAQSLCAGCHAVRVNQLSPVPVAPTFPDIVNREGVSRAALHRFLSNAHNYPEAMDFDLEPHHVEQLTDYMMTLKDPDFRKTPY